MNTPVPEADAPIIRFKKARVTFYESSLELRYLVLQNEKRCVAMLFLQYKGL